MKARWICRVPGMKRHGSGVHAEINAEPLQGGPYVDYHNGHTRIAYYGKPGGRVEIILTSAELAELKAAL